MNAERNFAEKARSFIENKRLQLAAGLTLVPAAVLSGQACGGGSAAEIGDASATTTSAPILSETKTPIVIQVSPTAKPTEVLPTPTPTVPLGVALDETQIRAKLEDVFTANQLPAGVCSFKVLDPLLQDLYKNFASDNSQGLHGGLASIHAQSDKAFQLSGNPAFEDLSLSLRIISYDSIVGLGKIRGWSAADVASVWATWKKNAYNAPPVCNISLGTK